MKIGRNAPCPCGSGKKYKHCCLNKSNVIPAIDLNYRRISKAYEDLEPKLEAYMDTHFDSESLEDAIYEFFCWPEHDDEYFTEEIMDSLQDLYRPWILYNWDCDQDPDKEGTQEGFNITIAEAYMKDNTHKISVKEKNLITGISRKPYSFWEVIAVKRGQHIDLKDIMTGKTITAQEHMGSEYVKPRDIVFARAVVVENIDMLVGMGRTIIPHGLKPGLIELREAIKENKGRITDKDLLEWDMDLRETYLDIDHYLHTPPKMQNTDGDPMELHKLVFEINDPATAFEKLASLCATESFVTIRKMAETDETGHLCKINFPWTQKGNKKNSLFDNTILGEIRIDHQKMTVQVNSAKRAKRIRKTIETRMGKDVKFKMDAIEDMNSIMAPGGKDFFDPGKIQAEQDELMQHPEVRQQLKEKILNYWDEWMDMKLPALGNKTPRKAVKTAEGREAVDALLYDMAAGKTPDLFFNELQQKGVQKVRKELGLD